MSEQLILFEGQEEIKVKTDQGETLINLANTGKICGLTRKDNTKNTERVRWTGSGGISEKLIKIRENLVKSTGGEIPPQEDYQKYIEEIDYVIDEMDNGDDRNSIFMSSWMSKRLTMNCSSQKAEQYKNFLATLDEKFSKGEITYTSEQLSKIVSDTVNGILPTMIKGITEQFAPILVETKNQVKEAREQVKTITNNLGMRNRNTQVIGRKLINRESEFYGKRIFSNNTEHRLNKSNLFNHFNVVSLDDIPITKFNDVVMYVENMELVSKEVVEKYSRKPTW